MPNTAPIPRGYYVGQRIKTTPDGYKITLRFFGKVSGGSRTKDCLSVIMDGTNTPMVIHKNFILPLDIKPNESQPK